MTLPRTLYLLLPLALLGCQERPQPESGLASTHPELARDLAEDSLTLPYNDSTSQLYNRYRITTEQYLNSGQYASGELYRGTLAPLDEASHPDVSAYRTQLRQGLKQGINFAGKYTVVTIGCGTACQQHYVIDRQTGQVLDKVEGSMGATYSPDSRLFIVNPPDAATDYTTCSQCTPQVYVFEQGRFQKLSE